MIQIALCDDNPTTITKLEDYLFEINIPDIEYDSFSSGLELLNYMKKNSTKYHIYILDISMPQITGIETAEMIRLNDKNCLIIYLTDYKEFVYQVFKSLPFRFLRKPIDFDTFRSVLIDAIRHLRTVGNLFFFKIEREHYQIPYSDIIFFQAQKRKIQLVTTTNEYLFYGKLKDVYDTIDKTLFAPCHVSYIVNMEQIHSIDEKNLILRNDVIIPISKKYRPVIKIKYLEFIKWRCGK